MKLCKGCDLEKPYNDFYTKSTNKDGFYTLCKLCSREKYGTRQKISNYGSMKKRAERNLLWVLDYFKSNPCVDCGQSNPLVLEFDHKSDKKYKVSVLIGTGQSLETLKKEIVKCDVRCANCHRIRTAHQFNWRMLQFI